MNPNATTFSRGRLFFDRAWTINLAGHQRAPGAPRSIRVGMRLDFYGALVSRDGCSQERDGWSNESGNEVRLLVIARSSSPC